MSSDHPDPELELVKLWQAQSTPREVIDMEALVVRSSAFSKVIRQRNWREWAAAILVSGGFAFLGFTAVGDPLMQLSCALTVAASALISWTLYRRGRTTESTMQDTAVETLRVHRHNLAQQVALLRAVPWWYLAPILPGGVLFNVASYLQMKRMHHGHSLGWVTLGIEAAALLIQLAIVIVIARANRVGAHQLAEELRALDEQIPPLP